MDTKAPDLKWYALRVKPQKEIIAQKILQRRGYQAFVPIEQKTLRKRRGDRKRILATYPMMRGYVMIGLKTDPDWYRIHSLDVVTGVVRFDGLPCEIPREGMAWLRKISSTNVPHNWSVSTLKAFVAGDIVDVITGPMEGHRFKVEKIDGDTALIFAEMFGATRKISVSVADLEAA